ncbi:MAG: amino acid adenylation domain-containing protein [Nitrospira sp.]|nr:amino acid adenylation domain-containing protein [Nitrospira sp.]
MQDKKNIESMYYLSPLQEGLLFHRVAEGETDPYFCHYTFLMEGALEYDAFEQAWQQMVQRHPILRTAFVWEGVDNPLQIVCRTLSLPIQRHDWRTLAPAERRQALESLLQRDRQEGFDFLRPPLMRLHLIAVDDRTWYLVNSHHHILLDGWSVALLLKDVVTAYESLRQGRPVKIASPPPYRNYITWLSKQDLGAAEAFWRASLAGIRTPTVLSLEEHQEAESHDHLPYAEQDIQLSDEQRDALKGFAQRHRLTINTVVQGAWALLLSRYSGEAEVLFGSTVSGRPAELPESDSMVGLFINTMPVRVSLPGDATVATWLQALQEQNSAIRQYEWTPLPSIQRWSEIPAGRSLFDTIVVFESFPEDESTGEQEGLKISPLSLEEKGAYTLTAGRNNYPLSLMAEPGAEVRLILCYARSRFSHAAISRMLRHYVTLLGRLASDGNLRLADLSPLSEDERRLVLAQGRGIAVESPEPPAPTCVHDLFERSVREHPDRVALVYEGEVLSGRELDGRANRLAAYLKTKGVGPEVLVGLCMERSLDLIVGLLAILKAGGGYVPLDPKLPAERVGYMLDDSGVHIVLTGSKWSEALPDTGIPRVYVDRDRPAIEACSDAPIGGWVRPDHAAYVIYTSGSTGRPKGVVVEHRQLVNYVQGLLDRLALPEAASFAMVSTVGADLGNTAIFGALCSGRPLHVLSTDRGFDPDAMAEYMHEHRVEVLKIAPSHLAGLLEAEHPSWVLPRHCVMLGGESAREGLIGRIRALAPDCAIVNHYGPTETTVGVLVHRLEEQAHTSAAMPIGRPLANSQAYILDRDLQPMPAGLPGELYLGGQGLARGYLQRPELTAERFIPDPYGLRPGGRLYRTGDRARYGTDGTIEFLGRVDNQVKLRGFRVELGEIDASLRRESGVMDAVTVVRTADDGAQQVVSYVTGPSTLDVAAIRAALARQLPDYMMPHTIVALESFPLTANGKLDRAALPNPTQQAAGAALSYAAPRTAIESALATIWGEVLHVEEVGVHDNFFDLGGDSILCLKIVGKAHRAGVKLTPKLVFQHQTVAAIAALLEEPAPVQSGQESTQETVPAAPFSLARLEPGRLQSLLATYEGAIEDLYPASPMQQGMLFHSLHGEQDGAYHNHVVYAFTQGLDPDALEQAWQQAVDRHAVLRTGFLSEAASEPLQAVFRHVRLPVERLDWRNLADDTSRQAALQDYLAADRARGFAFDQAPLMRLALIRRGEHSWWMVWSLHHAILDGSCQGLLVQEVMTAYEALQRAEVSTPKPGPSYRDYIQWFLRQDIAGTETFWRNYLQGFHEPTRLPERTEQRASDGVRYGEQRLDVSLDTLRALQRLAQSCRVTLNTVVQAAWALLLSRYSGERDVLFGVTVSGRPEEVPAGDAILGLFINTVPLRLLVAPTTSLPEWLREIQTRNVDLRRYEYSPLVQVQGWSEIRRGTSLFDSVLVFQNYLLDEAVQEYGKTFGIEAVDVEGWTNYPLTITVVPEDRLTLIFSYDRQRMSDEMVGRIVRHWAAMIDGMIERSDARLSELSALSQEERQHLLVDWNDTERSFPSDQCLHELFEAQVHRTPDRIAVSFEDVHLTYRELDARANQLAHALLKRAVGPAVPVGICVERSANLLVAMLGVLKAGAAYVPLDPTYPKDRLAYMFQDARIAVTLTQGRLLEDLGGTALHRIDLENWTLIAQESTDKPLVNHMSEHLAYVIYTSGSTGRPKGVMVRHRSAVNFLLAMQEALQPADGEVMASTTSISFDIALLELFLPLIVGGRTVVISRDMVVDGERLAQKLEQVGATIMQATPSGWRLLLDAAEIPRLRALCGGEACPPELAQAFQARGCEMWNLYGPTETTVWSMLTRVDHVDGIVPLGHPLANTQIYVLDANVMPTPIGVPGELYIGGEGVARGYWQRPDLTAERFVPDPFSRLPGARLYRTGDQARYQADGTLEFLGRIDHQVKVRGYRIELGEIETCLSRHPKIGRSIVTVRDAQGDKRIVAYCVPEAGSPVSPDELKRFLLEQLPDYMIPTTFVMLDTFPLTPNGKVDRKALPSPAYSPANDRQIGPHTPTEELIAGLWADVLAIPHVGTLDNFFELGGHSLLATQVLSRVRAAFRVELPLRTLFDRPTVKDFATAVDQTLMKGEGGAAPPLIAAPRTDHMPLSFAQQRLWFLAQMDPESGAYNLPFALRLRGALHGRILERSFLELLRRHEALRTIFPASDGEPRQVVVGADRFSMPIEDLTRLSDEERTAAVRQIEDSQAYQPFFLERDLPIRATLVALTTEEHLLLVTVHHIAADAWSLALVTHEIATIYNALAALPEGSEEVLEQALDTMLPDLPVQYRDFAAWQRQWLQGALLEREIGYWKQRLGSAPPQLALPTDHARPDVQRYRGGRATFHVPLEILEPLKLLSRRHGVTLFMTLLAAFKVLLSRCSGQTDILVGTDVANRNRAETEHLVGFFVNLLPLRTDLSGSPSFVELLGRVRETALGGYAHQDVPFEKIVESLKLARDPGRNPLVQVLFVLQNVPPPSLQLTGVSVEALEFEHEVSRFDMGLFMEEAEDGCSGLWKFSRDLFECETVAGWTQRFLLLLKEIGQSPELRIDRLDLEGMDAKEARSMEIKQRNEQRLQRFKNIKPKAVTLSQRTLVIGRPLSEAQSLPWLYTPAVDDVDLAGWVREHRSLLQGQLLKHGAVLFRGFPLKTVPEFEAVAQAVCQELFGEYGDLPREQSGRHVYGSTPYPSDKPILFHNESSHMHRWPQKQFFFCLQAAQEGGQTPIVDGRLMLQGLRPALRERLRTRQLMYVRHFVPGVDVSWQDFFRTTDKAVVEELCAKNGMVCQWLEKDGLRTRQVCPAVIEHPDTGESVFFNQIQLHHVSCLEPAVRESLLSMLGIDSLPRNVYYGDGTAIEDEVVDEIGELYERTAVRFPWQESDLVMLDNMLVAHARDPFVGPRKIVVAMGDMVAQSAVHVVRR